MNSIDPFLHQVIKPARYTGGEWNSFVKNWEKTPIRMALGFPDTYEIGMSNMAVPILYQILNGQPDVLAERVYAPWVDMEAVLRTKGIPLYSLETRHPLGEFDVIGFSLGYELTYTNVLNIMDMANIPVLSSRRNSAHPLIIAGGSNALNPEPMSDFIDMFIIGEAEESILRFLDVFREYGKDRKRLLLEASALPGFYVPGMYEVSYHQDGTIRSFQPREAKARPRIQRQIYLNGPYPVTSPVVPYIEVVHDRGAVEIQRGCSRGCRFCQAGMIYRPIREMPHDSVIERISELIKNCGYNEISLMSLSSGDYHDISGLINKLKTRFSEDHLTLSLPSLRLDKSSIQLIESLPQKRKTTLTFAPEAGSSRLRQAINKNAPEDLILDTFASAFETGWLNLKLYFMIGLPTETPDDVNAIPHLVAKILKLSGKARRPHLRVNVSTFVPKSHTACQWLAQDNEQQIYNKQDMLKSGLRRLGVHFSWQDARVSQLEAVLARGDRKLGQAIYQAWQSGCRLDTWNEHFDYSKWLEAFKNSSLDPSFYASRQRSFDEILPWQHIDTGVTTAFLKQECHYITEGKETGDCRRQSCNVCGLQRFSPECLNKAAEAGLKDS